MEGFLGFRAWRYGFLFYYYSPMRFTLWTRWLFFVEGTITICVAIWAMFVLPDFPENSSNWLTPAEKALAMKRMQEDAGHGDTQHVHLSDDLSKESLSRWPGLHLAVTDWKVWWLALTLLCIVISLSFNVYFPTLSATLGYGPIITLLLCAPPWLFATGVALSLSRYVICMYSLRQVLTPGIFGQALRQGWRKKQPYCFLLICRNLWLCSFCFNDEYCCPIFFTVG